MNQMKEGHAGKNRSQQKEVVVIKRKGGLEPQNHEHGSYGEVAVANPLSFCGPRSSVQNTTGGSTSTSLDSCSTFGMTKIWKDTVKVIETFRVGSVQLGGGRLDNQILSDPWLGTRNFEGATPSYSIVFNDKKEPSTKVRLKGFARDTQDTKETFNETQNSIEL
ncbi:hypothetical protein QJS10_CPB21g01114 [Acorus calamus]|uniref:Uncharacterized protein n=1 Tax=Acorus calamus TaxID=4465 RepID=A0AAV9C3B7_ACOCL|nr:hypothetical protein QJS10_CPB21g01114 [Acorus calamus]